MHGSSSVDNDQRPLHVGQPTIWRIPVHHHPDVAGVDALLFSGPLRVPEHADRRVHRQQLISQVRPQSKQLDNEFSWLNCFFVIGLIECYQLRGAEFAFRCLRQRDGDGNSGGCNTGGFRRDRISVVGQHAVAAGLPGRLSSAGLHRPALFPKTEIEPQVQFPPSRFFSRFFSRF